jgi:hypothetical protein
LCVIGSVAWQSSCTLVTRLSEVFVAPFPSYTHYIAPSLRLFVPNSLMVYHLLFLSEVCALSICRESPSHSQLLGFLNNNNLFIIIINIIINLEP